MSENLLIRDCSSKKTNKKSSKITFAGIIVVICSIILAYLILNALSIPFELDSNLNRFLWFFVCPVLMGVLLYFVYFKKNSRINVKKLKESLQKRNKSNFQIKAIGIIFVIFLPILLVSIFSLYLGLGNYYFASKPYTEQVKVDSALCHYSFRRQSYFEISIINTANSISHLNFPYELCKTYKDIDRIGGKYIQLYGRKSTLGVVYDGFYYPDNFIYIVRNDWVHKGVENLNNKNYAEALKWFQKSADQGSMIAEFNLGLLYWRGMGVPVNYVESGKWFQKAAIQGMPAAQYKLALLYHQGMGFKVDYPQALYWLKKAADQGMPIAQTAIGFMYYDGDIVKDRVKAKEWFEKSAAQNDARAQYFLGLIYQKGDDVTQSDAEAIKWFRKSAENGLAEGQYMMGLAYYAGKIGPINDIEAKKWLTKAAAQGDPKAIELLGEIEHDAQVNKVLKIIKSNHEAESKLVKSNRAYISVGNAYYEKTGNVLSKDYYTIGPKMTPQWVK